MEYYHLVTRKPMYKGQVIDFSNGEHNRLYEFWMKREERTREPYEKPLQNLFG